MGTWRHIAVEEPGDLTGTPRVVRHCSGLAVLMERRVQRGIGVGDLADHQVAAGWQGIFDLVHGCLCQVVAVAGVTDVAENLHQQHRDRLAEIERVLSSS
jgi:hypothetical protein